jgi:DUF4097 and DUF4098 domain-containing protein YvlB
MAPNARFTILAVLTVVELALLGEIIRVSGLAHDSSGMALHMGIVPAIAAGPSETVYNKTFTTHGAPTVYIDDGDSAVTVTVREGSTIGVREKLSRGLRRPKSHLDVSFESDNLRIVRNGSDRNFIVSGGVLRAFDITVPPGTRLEIANADNITVSGLRESAKLHSENGDIIVRDHRAAIAASSGNGRIELHDVAGASADVVSGNGHIVLDRVNAGSLTVHADNGHIEGTDVATQGGTIAAGNGHIELSLARDNDLTITAHASSGKVLIESPLSVEASSKNDDDDSDQTRTVRIGNGAGVLQVTSDNGKIKMSQGSVL